MSCIIAWTDAANDDAFNIFHHIRQEDLAAAIDFYRALDKTLNLLADHPGIGVSRVYETAGQVSMIPIDRPFQKYLLFFEHELRDCPPVGAKSELVVLRIFRASQNIAFFLGELT